MKSFKEILVENKHGGTSLEDLKQWAEKQTGFVSYEEDYGEYNGEEYGEVTITFKKNMDAVRAGRKSMKSAFEISSFGSRVDVGDSKIVIELYDKYIRRK